MSTILRWWALICTIVTGAIVAGSQGLFHTLWVDDLSKLSFLAISLFTILSGFVGVLTYRIHVKEDLRNKKYLPGCWFASELLMGVGMMGTLLGFILMFQANVAHIDFTNVDTAKSILAQLTKGTTTAVVTTFVGLLTSLLLKAQLINLEMNLDEVFRE